MKRPKSEQTPSGGTGGGGRRLRLSHFLMGIAALYLLFISFKFPHFLQMASSLSGDDTLIQLHRSSSSSSIVEDEGSDSDLSSKPTIFHRKLEDNENENDEDEHIIAPPHDLDEQHNTQFQIQPIKPLQHRYGRITGEMMRRMNKRSGLSSFERMADEAWTLGSKAWQELEEDFDVERANQATKIMERKEEDACPASVHVNGEKFAKGDNLMFLPCGLKAGSSITIMGTPHSAHEEYVPQRSRMRDGDATVWVSQFKVELLGLKVVDGEDPPRILHLNPRLKGDWSRRSVIEHNTCYRMQWGMAQRCDGKPSRHTDDMLVDGFQRCEKWAHSDIIDSKEAKTHSWFQRFVGREQKPEVTWPFAFVEDRLFVLTLRAGVEGYHISVGGRHVTSFPYRTARRLDQEILHLGMVSRLKINNRDIDALYIRMVHSYSLLRCFSHMQLVLLQAGFTLEDATGLTITGDLDVHSVYATSLPISHPSFSLQRVLEMSEKWKARPLPKSPVQLFIGILSATNHFAERMAVRKTWMQSPAVKSSNVVARFFVALSPRKEVNAVLKKEAAYFGDTVILPFMDRYELVVLKTIAICEYGVHNVTASHIMKCDDDTFVRIDTVLKEISGIARKRSLYMGNLNLLHRPLRTGKWAVTFEEWPEAVYPPYANGPGYIISSDITRFIISQHANHTLRLFKMEDVSMGMWVEQFNSTSTVQYSHNWKFCQYGCMENYFTAHYQSPRQMLCLWENLARGHARCCNYR